MSEPTPSSASIRILDLDLAAVVRELFSGKTLPVAKRAKEPLPGSLTESLIASLARRSIGDTHDLYADHTVTIFASGEQKLEYETSVAGRKVFVLLDFPTLDEKAVPREIFQLASALLTANYVSLAQQAGDAALRAGAKEVHLLMPNYVNARQDKTHKKRGPISAAIIAANFELYYDTVTSLHLHSPAIEGMLPPGRLLNISPNEFFGPSFVCRNPETFEPIATNEVTVEGVNTLFSKLCVISPDVGGTANARDFAKYCKSLAAALTGADEDNIVDIPLASIDKRRSGPNASEVMNILGRENIEGRQAIIFDDMGDTFGTAVHAADALKNAGARGVEFCGTHGYFSGEALKRITESQIDRVTVTNSMALRPAVLQNPKVRVIDIAPILAQVIADLTTDPEPNLRIAKRHEGSDALRLRSGRYADAMIPVTHLQP